MSVYDVFNKINEYELAVRGADMGFSFDRAVEKLAYDPVVRMWESYYKGEVEEVNRDKEMSAGSRREIRRKSLRIPKLIVGRWAETLFGEEFKITLRDDRETEKFKPYERMLRVQLIKAAAAGFSLGTSAIMASAEEGELKLEIIKYWNIYPIVYSADRMDAVAFVKQEAVAEGTKYTISVHAKVEGGHMVRNLYAVEKSASAGKAGEIAFSEPLAEGGRAHFLRNRIYAIIKPNGANDYTETLPFGQSVYNDAMAAIDDVDLASGQLRRDMREGAQVTSISRNMMVADVMGDKKEYCFDNSDGKVFFVNQTPGPDGTLEKPIYEKYVPDIRGEQFFHVIEKSLDIATAQSGLGKGALEVISYATATQVAHTEVDKMRAKSMHQQYFEEEVKALVRAIGQAVGGMDTGVVNVVWEDSVIADTGEQKRLAMLEVDAGLISKAEYRRRFYGETPEEAADRIAEIEADSKKGAAHDFLEFED
jgi:A118 family predicted phage portal protein